MGNAKETFDMVPTSDMVPRLMAEQNLKLEEQNLRLARIEKMLAGRYAAMQAEENDILRPEAAAKFIDLALPTLYTKTSRGEIPHMKKGGRLYFSKKELLEYIQAGRIRTKAEIAAGAMDMIAKGGRK